MSRKKNEPTPSAPEYGTAEYSEWYTKHVAPRLAPARTSHKIRNSVLGTFAGIVAIVIIANAASGGGSGGDKAASNPQATATLAPADNAQPSKKPAHKAHPPAKKRVAAPTRPAPKATKPTVDMGDPVNEMSVVPGTCKIDPITNWPQAMVKVVNPTADPSTFSATVVFSSLDGKTQYATGFVLVDHVGHGVTTQQQSTGFAEVSAGSSLKCALTDQSRFAS